MGGVYIRGGGRKGGLQSSLSRRGVKISSMHVQYAYSKYLPTKRGGKGAGEGTYRTEVEGGTGGTERDNECA